MLATIAKLLLVAGALSLGSGLAAAQSKDAAPPPPAAPPAASPPAPPPPTSAPAGTRAVVVDLGTMDALMGKSVRSSTGEDMGRLVDLIVETSGQIRAAIIDFGGVLGVGSRKVAVDWRALDFSGSAKGGPIKLALTRNQVRLSPEYRAGEPIVILEDSGPEAAQAAPVPKSAAPPATPAPPAK